MDDLRIHLDEYTNADNMNYEIHEIFPLTEMEVIQCQMRYENAAN